MRVVEVTQESLQPRGILLAVTFANFALKVKFSLVEDTTSLNSTLKVNSATRDVSTGYGSDFRYAFSDSVRSKRFETGFGPFPSSHTKNSIPGFAGV